MNTNKTKITWTASGPDSHIEYAVEAKSIRAAVLAARSWVRNNCANGEGKITIYEGDQPVRVDECSRYTAIRWKTIG